MEVFSVDCCTVSVRNFPTRAEKIDSLKDYLEALEKEAQGVKERIRELEKEG